MVANIFAQPFAEQADFFRKKINLPSERWDDIQKSAHDRGFIVASANKADLVADLRNTIDKCITEGKSLGWYQKNFDEIVKKHGWTGWTGEGTKAGRDWRTMITYQTNMSISYAAGRWKQLHDPDLIKLRPYLTYHHADGVRQPRPHHQSWNGFTAPRDHPFFQTHACPNGWRCHCKLSAASESDYTDAKAAGKHQPPEGWDAIDPKTGEPVGIDKGFGYAPGANADKPLKHFIDQKLINLDAPIGASMWQSIKPVLKAEQSAAVRDMVAVAAASMEPTGASVVAHVIEPDTVTVLAARGVALNDAAIWLRDRELIHAIRGTKDARGAALPLEVWLKLPTYLDSAIPYLDTENNTLLYAFDLPDVTGKVVVRINHSKKVKDGGKRKIISSNFIVTGGIIDEKHMGMSRYVPLVKVP